jgi:hypothetical protein
LEDSHHVAAAGGASSVDSTSASIVEQVCEESALNPKCGNVKLNFLQVSPIVVVFSCLPTSFSFSSF